MKNQYSFVPLLLIVMFFTNPSKAQNESGILSLLFYGAEDIVDQAEEFVSLSVDAVWFASSLLNTNTTTGTLKQSADNLNYWTYSYEPSDKMVMKFANNAEIYFKFSSIDGFVEKTEWEFKNSHAMDFTSEIPGMINLRIQSRIGPTNDRIEWQRTITGTTTIEGTKLEVNLVNTGNKNEDVSSGYAFGDYYNQNSGTVSSPDASFNISEWYKTNLGHNSNKGIYVQSREIFTNNSASGNFGTYQFNNARCFWVGGTAFGDSAYVGVYNQAIEVYNWSASGQLLKNGQLYGNIQYDRTVAENSNGAYIVANCTDGKTFYLFRVLYPPVISTHAGSNIITEKLFQNYPNPFSLATSITYLLSRESDVEIKIYNSIGQTIEEVKLKNQAPGQHRFDFDASDLTPGIYYYNIKTGLFSETKKMLLKR
jgi:hypothetical protein